MNPSFSGKSAHCKVFGAFGLRRPRGIRGKVEGGGVSFNLARFPGLTLGGGAGHVGLRTLGPPSEAAFMQFRDRYAV